MAETTAPCLHCLLNAAIDFYQTKYGDEDGMDPYVIIAALINSAQDVLEHCPSEEERLEIIDQIRNILRENDHRRVVERAASSRGQTLN